ncbi:MAG: ABC transporter permease [Nitrospinae bacterium]|nr:ABC transporter permease [Nitrospinota bacterium]
MTLGVVIGIASLTVIVAIGEGAKAKVLARISDMGFGPEAFSVAAGAGRLFFARTKTPTTLTLADVDDIRAMPTVQAAVPHQRQSMRMVYKRNNTFTRVYGVTPEWQSARLWKLSDGSFFTDEDMKRKAKVAVLGATPAGKLFGDEDPVGKMVRIGKVYFRVAGVLEKKGVTESGFDPDDRVIVPLSTSISRLFRQTWLFSIRIHTLDPSMVQETMEGVRQLLRKNHNLSVFAEDDFRFITPEGIMEWVTAEERALNRMLVLISAVSLLVGGIVIMNIMLVSIRERIREIGIRRCFGARRSDITQQFLFESIFVSILGGIAGCALGVTISFVLKNLHVLAAKPTWESFVVAFAFSAAVGLVFGIQPARKAASLSPEETIR